MSNIKIFKFRSNSLMVINTYRTNTCGQFSERRVSNLLSIHYNGALGFDLIGRQSSLCKVDFNIDLNLLND